MKFGDFLKEHSNDPLLDEYSAKLAWDYQQARIDEIEAKVDWLQSVINKGMLPEGYTPMPIEPSPAMIQAMVWWCPELSLSTGDLVEFYQDMIRAETDAREHSSDCDMERLSAFECPECTCKEQE